MEVDSSNVLVVGGGSEIAQALLEVLSAKGMTKVVLAGPREASLDRVAHSLARLKNVAVSTCYLDLADSQALPEALDKVLELLPSLDWVVVAAGELGDQRVDEGDAVRIADMIGVNFTGPAVVLGVTAQVMKEQGSGTIVVYSSVAAERVRGSNYLYGAAKAGLDGYALAMGERLLPRVHVHVVRPGPVRTKMISHKTPPLATSAQRVAVDTIGGVAKGRRIIWSPWWWRPVMSIYRHLPREVARRLRV